jgi:hypothetical protein
MNGLKSLMDRGVNVFIAGQDFGWDLASGDTRANGNAATKDFYTTYCMAQFINDGDATNTPLTAVANEPIFKTVSSSSVTNPYGGSNLYPEVIKPLNGAEAIFCYNKNTSKVAAIRGERNGYKLVYLGVGLEQLTPSVGDQITSLTKRWFAGEISTVEFDNLLTVCSVYPNPADDLVRITIPESSSNTILRLYDVNTRIVHEELIAAGSLFFQLQTEHIPSGSYRLSVSQDNGNTLNTATLNIIH